MRFNYLTRGGQWYIVRSVPFGFDCVLNLFVRMNDEKNNAPFMCVWSRLIQLYIAMRRWHFGSFCNNSIRNGVVFYFVEKICRPKILIRTTTIYWHSFYSIDGTPNNNWYVILVMIKRQLLKVVSITLGKKK